MLRFKPNGNREAGLTEGTAIAGKHTIERTITWLRNGGWQYEFRCSCGWGGRNMSGHYRTNLAAVEHVGKGAIEASKVGE
jgi:hypothetical protein